MLSALFKLVKEKNISIGNQIVEIKCIIIKETHVEFVEILVLVISLLYYFCTTHCHIFVLFFPYN